MIVGPLLSALFRLVSRAFAAIIIVPFVAIGVVNALWEAVILLLFVVGPLGHHVTDFHDGLGLLTAKVSEDVTVEEALMVAVDDILLGDVGDGGVFLKETLHIFSQELVPGLFTLRQIVMSTCAS